MLLLVELLEDPTEIPPDAPLEDPTEMPPDAPLEDPTEIPPDAPLEDVLAVVIVPDAPPVDPGTLPPVELGDMKGKLSMHRPPCWIYPAPVILVDDHDDELPEFE